MQHALANFASAIQNLDSNALQVKTENPDKNKERKLNYRKILELNIIHLLNETEWSTFASEWTIDHANEYIYTECGQTYPMDLK